jgi:hypothetical protein
LEKGAGAYLDDHKSVTVRIGLGKVGCLLPARDVKARNPSLGEAGEASKGNGKGDGLHLDRFMRLFLGVVVCW